MHEDHLRVTLATVTRAGLLARLTTLHDNEVRDNVAGSFVQSREDFAHVVLLRTFAKGEEG